MAYLHIVNSTLQMFSFQYYLPHASDEFKELSNGTKQRIFKTGRRVQDIPPGGQIRVGNLDMDEMTAKLIVKQHAAYGLRHVSELSRERDYVGLIWNLGKPIEFDAITGTMLSNSNFLDERARDIREDTAAAVSAQIQNSMNELGVDVPRVEIVTVEETNRGATPKISEGFETLKEGQVSKHGGKPSRRGNFPY